MERGDPEAISLRGVPSFRSGSSSRRHERASAFPTAVLAGGLLLAALRHPLTGATEVAAGRPRRKRPFGCSDLRQWAL